MLQFNKVYCMDCLEGIKQMEEQHLIPDLIICGPPYQFEARRGGIHIGNGGKILYDDIIELDTCNFDFEMFIPKILDLQRNRVNAYFFCNKVLVPKYLNEALIRGLNFDILIVKKDNPIPAHANSYTPELEYIIFLRSPGVYFNGNLRSDSIYKKYFNIDGIGHYNLIHPNQKPLILIEKFIKISSKEGHIVLDCFVGSGTTLIAAKNTNRKFIGFEINSKYADITYKRLMSKNIYEFQEQE